MVTMRDLLDSPEGRILRELDEQERICCRLGLDGPLSELARTCPIQDQSAQAMRSITQ